MLIVGLTGGIGSGKTTTSRYFEQLGVPVIDADLIVHQLQQPGQPALAEIAERFGAGVLRADGSLDRQRLRQQVFNDPRQREALEAILHPRARQELLRQIAELDTDYCIVAVPLLIESGWDELVHRVLVVDAPRELQIRRSRQRDQLSTEQVEAVIDSQLDRQARLDAADDVITNDGDQQALREQVARLHQRYQRLATRPPEPRPPT